MNTWQRLMQGLVAWVGWGRRWRETQTRNAIVRLALLSVLVVAACTDGRHSPADGGVVDSGQAGQDGGPSDDAGTPDATPDASNPDGSTPDGGTTPHPCAAVLNRTAPTTFYEAARCLFEGDTPPQTGVQPGVFNPGRMYTDL